MRNPDFVIIDPPEVVAEKLRLARRLNERPLGEPSLFDELMADRRRERERELAEEGFRSGYPPHLSHNCTM
jgi:hypothetical protein